MRKLEENSIKFSGKLTNKFFEKYRATSDEVPGRIAIQGVVKNSIFGSYMNLKFTVVDKDDEIVMQVGEVDLYDGQIVIFDGWEKVFDVTIK
jgi:hypothetical protein